MSEAVIFEYPYNLFLMERLEFVVICQNELEAKIMRIIEAEMTREKAEWQKRVEVATEAKKTPPKEPKEYWVRLSQSQIIARLYLYDSAKLIKPETEDMESDEWREYLAKKALSISKSTLRKAIDRLIAKGLLVMRSKPGDEFGAPIYTLHRANVQKAMKALPSEPFGIFHMGGVSSFESGGESQTLELPPSEIGTGEVDNLEVPPATSETPQSQNLEVNKDIGIESLENDKNTERENASAHAPTRAPAVSLEQESETRTNVSPKPHDILAVRLEDGSEALAQVERYEGKQQMRVIWLEPCGIYVQASMATFGEARSYPLESTLPVPPDPNHTNHGFRAFGDYRVLSEEETAHLMLVPLYRRMDTQALTNDERDYPTHGAGGGLVPAHRADTVRDSGTALQRATAGQGATGDHLVLGATAPARTEQAAEGDVHGQLSEQTSPDLSQDGAARTSPSEPRASGGRKPREKPARTPPPAKEPEPEFVLTDLQMAFWQLWGEVWFNEGVPQKLNEKAYIGVKILAPLIKTAEELKSLTDYARKELAEREGIRRKRVYLGNCTSSYPGWKQEQRKDEPTPAPNGLPPSLTREQRKAMPVW